MRSRGSALCAAAILLVAAALRLWRLDWGLAEAVWFPDELGFTARVAAFFPFLLHSFALPRFDYPSLYGYLAGLAARAAYAAGLIGVPGRMSPDAALVARGVSAAAGIGTVAIVGMLAAQGYGRAVGFAAAALLAVAPLHAMHSHIAATDVLLTAAVALALVAALRLATDPRPGTAAVAGAAAGLAFTAKYTGLASLVPPLWALGERARRAPGRAAGLALAVLATAALAIAVVCPPCVLEPERMSSDVHLMRAVLEAKRCTFPNNCLTPVLGWHGHRWIYQLAAGLPYALGWPLWLLGLAGVALAAWRRTPADRLMLASLVPYFVAIGASRTVFPRYLLPLFPGLVVLAARAALALPRWLAAGVLATVLAYSLALTVTQVARFSGEEQVAIARWIAARAPGSRVALPRIHPVLDHFRLTAPLLAAGLVALPRVDGEWFTDAPDVFVLPDWYAIALRRDGRATPALADLERLEAGRAGYAPAARWRPWFLQRDLYVRLDPAFAGDLWQGAIGYSVWVRPER